MYITTASVVIYNSPKKDIQTVVTCLANSIVNTIYVIDNGPDNSKKEFAQNLSKKVVYVQGHGNIGYGSAHNIAIREAIRRGTKYHLVVNPDIEFMEGTLEQLVAFMDEQPSVGLAMPKVLYPNGDIQYLCKLLPTPVDLIFRRFLFFLPGNNKRKMTYELRDFDYSKIHFNVPSLSGCFMMFRTDVLEQIDGFDERFFMYMEDVDLCRRVYDVAQTAFFPLIAIIHNYEKGSYKSLKQLRYHMLSAFKYFNKWGWFFDKKRNGMNRQRLDELLSIQNTKKYLI
jgi:GT2 family glycosyltransferase